MESLLAVAIVAIAGAALLSALASAVRSSREIALVTVARGLADQLLSEAAASPVPVPGSTAPLKPSGPRSGFLCVDHYDGWSESPPQDRFGRQLGTEGTLNGGVSTPRAAALQADAALLANFARTVLVEKVTPGGGGWVTTAGSTAFRRVTVRVTFNDNGQPRPLAESSRIVSYVAPSL
jgi:hypothetical protein